MFKSKEEIKRITASNTAATLSANTAVACTAAGPGIADTWQRLPIFSAGIRSSTVESTGSYDQTVIHFRQALYGAA